MLQICTDRWHICQFGKGVLQRCQMLGLLLIFLWSYRITCSTYSPEWFVSLHKIVTSFSIKFCNSRSSFLQLLNSTGLLKIHAVAEPRNSGISAKSCEIVKNTRNTAKFAWNSTKYMSVQHIWNLSWPLEQFTCRKLANLSWNFVTATSKQRTKTTGHYERHNKREDFSLTLYGVWKETAVSSNAGTCLTVRAGHDRRHENVLTSQMDLNLPSREILPCKLQSNTRERWEERNLLRCHFSALNCS